MKKIDTAVDFTKQLLQQAEEDDKLRKIEALENHKASAAVGEGYWPFHLKSLLKLLEEIRDD
tara:strand:- start:17247 stop:17432 length:186 start_codon:yes stop_codon:yes gene_type:complete